MGFGPQQPPATQDPFFTPPPYSGPTPPENPLFGKTEEAINNAVNSVVKSFTDLLLEVTKDSSQEIKSKVEEFISSRNRDQFAQTSEQNQNLAIENLPPAQPGYTRLYRGDVLDPNTGMPYEVNYGMNGSSGHGRGDASHRGNWWTTEPLKPMDYATTYGLPTPEGQRADQRFRYVDIPTDQLSSMAAYNVDPELLRRLVQENATQYLDEFLIPPSRTGGAKRVDPVYDPQAIASAIEDRLTGDLNTKNYGFFQALSSGLQDPAQGIYQQAKPLGFTFDQVEKDLTRAMEIIGSLSESQASGAVPDQNLINELRKIYERPYLTSTIGNTDGIIPRYVSSDKPVNFPGEIPQLSRLEKLGVAATPVSLPQVRRKKEELKPMTEQEINDLFGDTPSVVESMGEASSVMAEAASNATEKITEAAAQLDQSAQQTDRQNLAQQVMPTTPTVNAPQEERRSIFGRLSDWWKSRASFMGQRGTVQLPPDEERLPKSTGVDPKIAEAKYKELRASVRKMAENILDEAMATLDLIGGGVLSPVPKSVRSTDKFGKVVNTRPGAGGEWDWFDSLSPKEKKRLQGSWVGRKGVKGTTPDDMQRRMVDRGLISETASVDEAMKVWLDLTRKVDASRSMKAGKVPGQGNPFNIENFASQELSDLSLSVADIFQSTMEEAIIYIKQAINASLSSVDTETQEFAYETLSGSQIGPAGVYKKSLDFTDLQSEAGKALTMSFSEFSNELMKRALESVGQQKVAGLETLVPQTFLPGIKAGQPGTIVDNYFNQPGSPEYTPIPQISPENILALGNEGIKKLYDSMMQLANVAGDIFGPAVGELPPFLQNPETQQDASSKFNPFEQSIANIFKSADDIDQALNEFLASVIEGGKVFLSEASSSVNNYGEVYAKATDESGNQLRYAIGTVEKVGRGYTGQYMRTNGDIREVAAGPNGEAFKTRAEAVAAIFSEFTREFQEFSKYVAEAEAELNSSSEALKANAEAQQTNSEATQENTQTTESNTEASQQNTQTTEAQTQATEAQTQAGSAGGGAGQPPVPPTPSSAAQPPDDWNAESMLPLPPVPRQGGGGGDGSGGGGDDEDLTPYEALAKYAKKAVAEARDILENIPPTGEDPEGAIANLGETRAIKSFQNALVEAEKYVTLFSTDMADILYEFVRIKSSIAASSQILTNSITQENNVNEEYIQAKAEAAALIAQQNNLVREILLTDENYIDIRGQAVVANKQMQAATIESALASPDYGQAAADLAAAKAKQTSADQQAALAAGVPGAEAKLSKAAVSKYKGLLQSGQIYASGADAGDLESAAQGFDQLILKSKEFYDQLAATGQLDDPLAQAAIYDTIRNTETLIDTFVKAREAIDSMVTGIKTFGQESVPSVASLFGDKSADPRFAAMTAISRRADAQKKQASSIKTIAPEFRAETLDDAAKSAAALQEELNKIVGPGGINIEGNQALIDAFNKTQTAIDQATFSIDKYKAALDNPAALTSSTAITGQTGIVKALSTQLRAASKQKDPNERLREIAIVERELQIVKQLIASMPEIDTVVNPKAEQQVRILKAQVRNLEDAIGQARGGGVVGGGGGAGGGGGGRPPGGGRSGEGGGRASRGDIVSRVRSAGGLTGFFGSGALSSIRYGLPSMAIYGVVNNLKESIAEAERLQFNLSKIESQVQQTFGGESAGVVEGFKQKILDLSIETGYAADELALLSTQLIGAFSGSTIGGKAGADLVKSQMEGAAKLAQATGLPLQEITDGLTAASIAFGASFQKIGDISIALEAKTGVLSKETIAFIGDIAPVAEEAGFSLEEFSALSTLVQQRSGRTGASIAEQFGRIIPAITQNRDALYELAITNDSIGTPEFITALNNSDTKAILFGVGKQFNNLNKEAQDFIINLLGGRREAATLIPALANPAQLDALIEAAKNSGGSLEERFGKVKETLSNTFQRLNEEIRKFFVTILESGVQDLIKDILSLLGAITKGVGGILGAITPVLSAFDGLPIKILAIVGAIKAVNAALGKTEIGGGKGGGLASTLTGFKDIILNNIQKIPDMVRGSVTSGQIAIGRLPEEKVRGAQEIFSAMSGVDMTNDPLPSQNRRRTMRETYKNERFGAGRSRIGSAGTALKTGFGTSKAFVGGASSIGSGLIAAAGGPLALGIEGIAVAYTFIQDGVDKQRKALADLQAYADDTNTSIEDLRAKAEELSQQDPGISIGAQIAGFFTGNRYEGEAEFARSLLKNKEFLTESRKSVSDILTGNASQTQDFINTLANQADQSTTDLTNIVADKPGGLLGGGINTQSAADEILDKIPFAPGFDNQRGIRVAAEVARIKEGKDKGSYDVKKYIQAAFFSAPNEGAVQGTSDDVSLADSDLYKELQQASDNGDTLAQAAQQRLIALTSAVGETIFTIDGNVAGALAGSNWAADLKAIIDDPKGEYSDAEQEQARKIYDQLMEKAKLDPKLAELLNSQGYISAEAQASLMKLGELSDAYQSGAIGDSQFKSGLEALRASILEKIQTSSGPDKKALLDAYYNVDKTLKDFVLSKAQEALNTTLEIIGLTTDDGTVSALQQKQAAINAAINSGALTGDDLKKAAFSSIQTQKDLALALIKQADTVEEANQLASQPIDIPLETRQAAIRGSLQSMVGNWDKFTQHWKNWLGESFDDFLKYATEGLANGSLTIEQVKQMLVDRRTKLENQRKEYVMKNGQKEGDVFIAAFDQAIGGVNSMITSIDQTGALPGDPGSQVNTPQAQEQAARSRREAAAGVLKASANKDSIKIAQIDLATAEENLQKAKDAGITGEELDNLEAAVITARNSLTDAYKSLADSVRGIAKAQAAADKDNVKSAQLDLAQAQADYAAALASGDDVAANNAIAAGIAAEAAIRDAINNKRRVYANLMKALGSQDSLDQAQYDVDIAKMNLENAVGDEEKWQAWIDLIAAERAQREAFKRRRQDLVDLEKAKTEDPVTQAQMDLNLARQLVAEAQTMDEKIDAERAMIDAEKALAEAMKNVRDSKFNLRKAELDAIGDDIGAAQLAAQQAREQLNQALAAGNKGEAEINNLKAGVINADKAVRDAVFQGRMDDYKFLLDMGEITQSQYADYLEGLKTTLIPGTKQFKDLEVTIKQLRDDIGGNLQANLPTSLQLPTLYEVRRLNQTGQGATAGQSIGYQDNKNVQVTVYVNNGMSQEQVVNTFAKAINSGTTGLESKHY